VKDAGSARLAQWPEAMCGRAILTTPPEDLAELFRLDELPDITPRFNIAPGQPLLILRTIPSEPAARRVELARWGIENRDGTVGQDARRTPHLLARVESLFARGACRDAAAKRRCLALADGFYEWQGSARDRRPFHFRRHDHRPFGLAAIYERGADGVLECALLTTAAAPPVREIHDRMPIPLAPRDHAAWLDPSVTAETVVRALAKVDPEADLVCAAVSTFVNDARHEGIECLTPAAQRSLF
jgi:putative SOS response-associated peptidase YedK